MRKQGAAARGLPFESVAEHVGVHEHQEQVRLSAEVLRHRFRRLRRGGKMDEAILQIDRRSMEDTVAFGGPPKVGGYDLVDGGWGHNNLGCHGRTCCGHPDKGRSAYASEMAGTSPAITIDKVDDNIDNYAAPRRSPPPGGGTGIPSATYSLSLLRRVRMEMPRMLAACVRLPRQWRSVSRMRSRSTSATVRPTRLWVICSAAMAACATTGVRLWSMR